MRRLYVILTAVLSGCLLPGFGEPAASDAEFKKLSQAELEQRLVDIDAELEQLAAFTLRRGVGSLGYRSELHINSNATEQIRIELGTPSAIDQIVLVPMLLQESQVGLQAEGFPREFKILAGTDETTHTIAAFSAEDQVTSRIAPLVISFTPIEASWITIEAAELGPRIWDDRFTLQLSEVMVFSGMDNVALHKPVTIPTSTPYADASRQPKSLVDGFTPFVMDAAQGERSQTLLMKVKESETVPTLTVSLDAPYPVSQINLHTASVGYSIPMADFSSRAVPRHIRVLGANQEDFSDAAVLCQFRQRSIYDNGPIMMRRFAETECRYIRLEILNDDPVIIRRSNPPSIAFSEIEIIAEGRNAALNAPVSANSGLSCKPTTLTRITDGHTYYGEVLPIRDWMNQLARRHDLERERPLVEAELAHRYQVQQARLKRLKLLLGILAFGTAVCGLIIWLLHRRKMKQLKNRIAADLHDELGANLHGIGLLTNLAEEAKNNPDHLMDYLHRIQAVVKRSGLAIRHVTDLQETSELFPELTDDMQRAAERIVARQDHQISIEGKELLSRIPQPVRVDLFLFYKECLINISRHSGAAKLATHLKLTPREIRLSIADNGCGMPGEKDGRVPPSLKRRARLMHAKVQVSTPEEGGTKIELSLRPRTSLFQSRQNNHE